MDQLKTKARHDNAIMRALKLSHISHAIAETSKGQLSLRLDYEGGAKDYHFVLDAVPVEKGKNEELIRLFYGEADRL